MVNDKINKKNLNENFNFRPIKTSETSSFKGKSIKAKPVTIPKSAFVPKKK